MTILSKSHLFKRCSTVPFEDCSFVLKAADHRDDSDYNGSGSGNGDYEIEDDDLISTTADTQGSPGIAEFITDRLFVILGVILSLVVLAIALCFLIRCCYGKRGTRVLRRIQSSFRRGKSRTRTHEDCSHDAAPHQSGLAGDVLKKDADKNVTILGM